MKSINDIMEQRRRIFDTINGNLLDQYGYIDKDVKRTKSGYFEVVSFLCNRYISNILWAYSYDIKPDKKVDKKIYELKDKQKELFEMRRDLHRTIQKTML